MKPFVALFLSALLQLSVFSQTPTPFSSEEKALIHSGEASDPMRVYLITNRDDSLLLRTPSQRVKADPEDKDLQAFIQRLYETVTDSASMGVGIAAPQVGLLRQIIWVQRFDRDGYPFEAYLNPTILEYSRETQTGREGCLSIPDESDSVNRALQILIEYELADGSHHTELVEGFTAVIFQHEIDHLHGILYKDHLEQELAEAPALVQTASPRPMAEDFYWQQAVKYYMEIDMDVEKHQYDGFQRLTYFNHSPDTLKRVFYHLYFNAFQSGSMMDIRSQNISDPSSKIGNRISALSEDEIGYLRTNSLTQDGTAVSFSEEGTILVVELANPMLPGDSTVFEMDYQAQVPVQIRRSGRNNAGGVDYTMTQWYPKLCEYDREGWHANPYIGREFHGVWGDYEVKITIDSSYSIGGTGYLQNPEEIGHGYLLAGQAQQVGTSDQLTWHFVAPNVHDFAWGADPEYVHDVIPIPQGPELHFFYLPGSQTQTWKDMQPYAVRMFNIMNSQFGKYPYRQYSVVQGGDGGMEYAMCTMVSGNRTLESLIGVTVHEAVHSWFQHVLGTNESLYAWMDEGFTSYTEDYLMDQLFKTKLLNPQYLSYLNYIDFIATGLEEPSSIHADHFQTNRAYSRSAYTKGAITLHQLNYVIGHQAFVRGMRRYYNEWQFKHPTPTDFKRVMEKESGLELDWYFEHWINSTNTIDYKIAAVNKSSDKTKTHIELERVGAIPMPIDLVVSYKDGTVEYFYLPLRIMRGEKGGDYYTVAPSMIDDWIWTQPRYTLVLDKPRDDIQSIEIDPTYRMADVKRKDNIWPKNYSKLYESYGAASIE
ncbi:MAG: peptide deformylase [Bacteroidota bacterium]